MFSPFLDKRIATGAWSWKKKHAVKNCALRCLYKGGLYTRERGQDDRIAIWAPLTPQERESPLVSEPATSMRVEKQVYTFITGTPH